MSQKPTIINSPFEEPKAHWQVFEGRPTVPQKSRRPAMYSSSLDGPAEPIGVVEAVRNELRQWREQALQGDGGVTRTTMELMRHWHAEGRKHRLFFAQIEAAESVIFLNEARGDHLQGIDIPLDQPSQEAQEAGIKAFRRYCCKMATGCGKTTVMAMLTAWSILNKVANPKDGRYSDAVLIVCPNVTIKDRLRELSPDLGDASIYRTADLVPPSLMHSLRKGKVYATNWHLFERQSPSVGGKSGRVLRVGKRITVRENIRIGSKRTVLHGKRYMTPSDFSARRTVSGFRVLREERDSGGQLVSATVETEKYVESDEALVRRVLGRHIGSKTNILVINDEAHHAYRVKSDGEVSDIGDEEGALAYRNEATVWVNGLDCVNRVRGINFCVDFSATPCYLLATGKEANKIFPWTVSNFGLEDAIESGLVKIPLLAVQDTTNKKIPGYLNIWDWVLKQIEEFEPSGNDDAISPRVVLKYAHTPIAMLASQWHKEFKKWQRSGEKDQRPPVFIVVCKNIALAKTVFRWIAEGKGPSGVPNLNVEALRNAPNSEHTIRVDSSVAEEADSGKKSDNSRWMRWVLSTVGKDQWPLDSHGLELCPPEFEELAKKMNRSSSPPGRDVRCIVSVSMLTEGWDCNTVTHIIGLRPFMSQLLCEQVIGRGLRRRNYRPIQTRGGKLRMTEETATVFGVPYRSIPHIDPTTTNGENEERYHIFAMPERASLEIRFPRVEGYYVAAGKSLWLDLDVVPRLVLDPLNIPPEVSLKAGILSNEKRPSVSGPGELSDVSLREFRKERRTQERLFDLANHLLSVYDCRDVPIPKHELFPQLLAIAQEYYDKKVTPTPPNKKVDVFLAPYYGYMVEQILGAVRSESDARAPELPVCDPTHEFGSTVDVNFYTSRKPMYVTKSHVNAVVSDSSLEESAARYLDGHPAVRSFVKNAELGFRIRYLHNGQIRVYLPDFIIWYVGESEHLCVLEMKGYDDPLVEVKAAAARRWVRAVNAAREYGQWEYVLIKDLGDLQAHLGSRG